MAIKLLLEAVAGAVQLLVLIMRWTLRSAQTQTEAVGNLLIGVGFSHFDPHMAY
jgi:hypothetical protein